MGKENLLCADKCEQKIGIIHQILHCLDWCKKWGKTYRNWFLSLLIEMITFELCHEVYKRMDNITQSDCVFRIILGNSVMSTGCDVSILWM